MYQSRVVIFISFGWLDERKYYFCTELYSSDALHINIFVVFGFLLTILVISCYRNQENLVLKNLNGLTLKFELATLYSMVNYGLNSAFK